MKNQRQPHTQNSLEHSRETDENDVIKQVKKIPAEVTRSMWKDFFEAALKQNIPEQVFGTENKPGGKSGGDLKEGETVSLAVLKKDKTAAQPVEKKSEKAPISIEHRDYFRREFITTESALGSKEQMQTRQHIELLQVEIKKLIKASQEMEAAFKHVSHQVTVEQGPRKVGKYDVSFLEWVLLVVKSARMRVEDGQTWMTMFASKKRQKQFWNQFKKSGTSFLLSGERSTATQTG